MLDKINVGYIVKAWGIKGELKVEPLTDDVNRFKNLKKVYIDQKEYKVTHVRTGGGVAFVCLLNVNDRNTAELLKNKYMVIDREDAVSLSENEYFIGDLIGCMVYFEDETPLGEVIEVTPLNTDIFTVKTISNKIVRFPFLLDAVIKVDIIAQKITLNRKRYLEVCCYED